jgi:iron(III) transport system substrate-binding protein
MRARLFRVWLVLLASGVIAVAFAARSRAAELSVAEKLYADLGKLPPAERQQRLEDGARREGKLVFVHTWRNNMWEPHVALFKKRYPFLTVEANSTGSQDAAERLVSEETAGQHLTDIMNLAVPDLEVILARDFAARYPTPAVSAILPKYRGFLDPDNRWTPFYMSDFGISYNPKLVPPDKAPKTWFDLCDPQFKGNVSFDGPNIRFLVGIYAMMGDETTKEWLQCIGKNKPIVQLTTVTRFQLMLAGDHAVQGQTYTYYCYAAKAENPSAPCAIVQSAPMIGLAGAMVINRNTTHPHAAALLADWALSSESQDYAAKNLRGPLSLKHPYLADDAQIVVSGLPTKDVVDKVLAYWEQYVGR